MMMRNLLAFMIVGGAFLIVSWLLVAPFLGLPLPDSDLAKSAVNTYLTAGFIIVVGYFFGSSSGSKDKDDVLGRIASGDTNAKPPAP